MKRILAVNVLVNAIVPAMVLLATPGWGQDGPPCLQTGVKDVDVGGFTLRVTSRGGTCPPTIVLDAGLADDGLTSWSSIVNQLSTMALTIVYDRAGLGSSQPGPTPRSTQQIITELHALLLNGGFAPPFVLVGHSIGGPHIRAYARRYPAEVAGLVLVDGRHERFDEVFLEKYPKEYKAIYGPGGDLDRIFAGFPAAVQLEWAGMRDFLPSLGVLEPHPDVPVRVLTGGSGWTSSEWGLPQPIVDDLKQIWIESHEVLAGSFSRSAQKTIEDAGHYIQRDQPQVVIDAVREVLDAASPDLHSPPTARFDLSSEAPLEVSFDASTSVAADDSPIRSFMWDFGDGGTGEGETINHTYSNPGIYNVTLMATGENGLWSSARRSVTAGCPPGDPAPWVAVDLGAPRFPGNSHKDGECLELCAGGSLLLGRNDRLHFAYQELAGDFVSTARIEEVNEVPSMQVGLMARVSLDPGAMFSAMGVIRFSTAKSFRFAYRKTASGSVANRSGDSTSLPAWVRLERAGRTILGYSSTDGLTWKEVERLDLEGDPEKLLVGVFGLAAEPAEGHGFQPLEARVCIVEPPRTRFHRGDPNSSGTTDISNAIAIFGFLFLGTPTTLSCKESADVNNDATVDISDGIYLLSWLFTGGPEPAAPGPTGALCGVDPDPAGSAGDLGCDVYAPCQ